MLKIKDVSDSFYSTLLALWKNGDVVGKKALAMYYFLGGIEIKLLAIDIEKIYIVSDYKKHFNLQFETLESVADFLVKRYNLYFNDFQADQVIFDYMF